MDESWDVATAGPAGAEHRVMMIPGGMCTAEFYADVMAAPALARSGLGMVAVTQPGMGDTPAPEDVSMENYARLMAGFAHDNRCDVVVGHSLGANVALEMAASGLFGGPMVLLSPSFCRKDEASFLAGLDRVGRVPGLGALAWKAAMKMMPKAVKRMMPANRADVLAPLLGRTDPEGARRVVRGYYEYLDRYDGLAERLVDSDVPAWVVRGDHDEIGLQPAERETLEKGAHITMVTIPDAGHMVLVEQPAAVANVIVKAAATV
jgi:pimeloyl-ACP methyl ester carboxylesterase